jgi:hypothetical protein
MEPAEEAERHYLSLWIKYRGDSDNMRSIPPYQIVMYPGNPSVVALALFVFNFFI